MGDADLATDEGHGAWATRQRDECEGPCACVRRKAGRMTHIKLNHPSRKRCRTCGCERPEKEAAP